MNKIVQGLTVVEAEPPMESTKHLATINKLLKSPGRRKKSTFNNPAEQAVFKL